MPEKGRWQDVLELKGFLRQWLSEAAEVEGDQLGTCLLACCVLGEGAVYFPGKVKGLSLCKWKCLYKGSSRMGGCGSVPVPRNPETLVAQAQGFPQK